jgi:hypothetical protein
MSLEVIDALSVRRSAALRRHRTLEVLRGHAADNGMAELACLYAKSETVCGFEVLALGDLIIEFYERGRSSDASN